VYTTIDLTQYDYALGLCAYIHTHTHTFNTYLGGTDANQKQSTKDKLRPLDDTFILAKQRPAVRKHFEAPKLSRDYVPKAVTVVCL
jgi:hypothetical protein